MSLEEPLASFASTYNVTRQSSAGSYVKGIWHNAGGPTILAVEMVVQPLNGKELQQLPEGQRVKDNVKVYTETELVLANQAAAKKGDRLSYRGHMWEINFKMDWDGTPLSHFKYAASLVEEDS